MRSTAIVWCVFFFFQAEDGIRDLTVTGVQTCALPISYAVFQGVSAAVLPADDGRDGDGGAAGGGGDGDAGGQHEDDDRADHADRDGGAAAVCDPRRRPHRRRRRGHENPEVSTTEQLWQAESGFVSKHSTTP